LNLVIVRGTAVIDEDVEAAIALGNGIDGFLQRVVRCKVDLGGAEGGGR